MSDSPRSNSKRETYSQDEQWIPYGKQSIGSEEIHAINRVLESDFLTTGPALKAFEKAISEVSGAKYTVAVANGTLALDLAVQALDLPHRFHGLTSPITFAATASSVLRSKGQLQFSDVSTDFPNLDPLGLKTTMESFGAPHLVLPVSYAGRAAPLPAIQSLYQSYPTAIIEDASHAFGSQYQHDGKWYSCGSCTHSDLATFSFHPVKNITSGEGGAITTNCENLYKRLLKLREHGIQRTRDGFKSAHHQYQNKDLPWFYEVHEEGHNARLSDLHSALGLTQLKQLNAFKEKRKNLKDKYDQAFSEYPGLICPLEDSEHQNFWHIYPLQISLPQKEEKRLSLFHTLLDSKIRAQVHYIPLHYQPLFQQARFLSLQNAESFYAGMISLPLFPNLMDQEQDRVIQSILKWLKNNS